MSVLFSHISQSALTPFPSFPSFAHPWLLVLGFLKLFKIAFKLALVWWSPFYNNLFRLSLPVLYLFVAEFFFVVFWAFLLFLTVSVLLPFFLPFWFFGVYCMLVLSIIPLCDGVFILLCFFFFLFLFSFLYTLVVFFYFFPLLDYFFVCSVVSVLFLLAFILRWRQNKIK